MVPGERPIGGESRERIALRSISPIAVQRLVNHTLSTVGRNKGSADIDDADATSDAHAGDNVEPC